MNDKEMRMEKNKKIFWYGIPAYGHIHSCLYFARCLEANDFHVVYYSTKEFQTVIEANGCEFRSYPIRQDELDLSDGQRILKLYRLILQYSVKMLPILLEEAKKDQPGGVVFDSLALWGRLIKEQLQIPGFSFYSIVAIDRIGGAGFWNYSRGFGRGFFRHVNEIPLAFKLRWKLQKGWGRTKLGMMEVLMNKGDYNLLGYSRLFQPGGRSFGKSYLFLGPLAPHRIAIEKNDFICPDEKIIYISLGTIFNQNLRLLKQIIRQLGRTKNEKDGQYVVVMVWQGADEERKRMFPDNFIVCEFVNQGEILKRASLFISAGGTNSIHEALYYGVPCLMCPQQGEQRINAERFEKLGFGKILYNPEHLYEEAMAAMDLKNTWNEQRRRELSNACVKKGIQIFQQLI